MEQSNMRLSRISLFILVVASFQSIAADNLYLKYTMKALSKDVDQIYEPLKKPAAEVTAEAIVNAIARTRVSSFHLQLITERRETEMFPPILAGLSAEEIKEQLSKYAEHLDKARAKLAEIENDLKIQLDLPNADRSFKKLNDQRVELTNLMKAAHAAFKPKTP